MVKINLAAWRERRESGRAFWKPPTPRRGDSGNIGPYDMVNALRDLSTRADEQIDDLHRRLEEHKQREVREEVLEGLFDQIPADVREIIVTNIQKELGLAADGIYGPRTKKVMQPKDGVPGASTVEALREYQRSLPVHFVPMDAPGPDEHDEPGIYIRYDPRDKTKY